MRCRQFEKLLPDYIDEILPSNQQAEVRDHLSHCPPCQESLRLQEFLSATASKMKLSAPGDWLWTRIRANVAEEKTRKVRPFSRFWVAAGSVAAVLLVLVTTMAIIKNASQAPTDIAQRPTVYVEESRQLSREEFLLAQHGRLMLETEMSQPFPANPATPAVFLTSYSY